MNAVVLAQILQTALALAESGTEIYNFLSSVTQRVQAAQMAGADLTVADWEFIDQAAAENLAKVLGYTSATEALLAAANAQRAPSAGAPAASPASADQAGADQESGSAGS